MRIFAHAMLFAAVCYATVPCAAQDVRIPPIKALRDVKPNAEVFKVSDYNKPIVIRSSKEGGKYFSNDALAGLLKQVDFNQQIVLVFAWEGSGQDRLEYDVLESFPEQIVFSYSPGATDDLQSHVHVFALRSNVKWRFKGAAAVLPVTEADEYIKVEVKGKLNSQVLAIGGETTGIVVSARGITWELDLGRHVELRRRAVELHERSVIVKGVLNVKKGVEIRQRWIVTVNSLTAADAEAGDKSSYLSEDGSLRHSLVLRDSQTGFAGDTGHIWTIETDGSWRHQTFLNEMIRKPEHTGKFTERQLQSLAGYLAKYDLLGLPERMGKDPGVNPHVFAMSFGKKQVAMIGAGGASLPPVDPKNLEAPEQRFAALMRLLQGGMKFKESEEE